MRDLMKCCKMLYDMHVSMTKQSGDFQKLIFTKTITQQYRYRLFSLHFKYIVTDSWKMCRDYENYPFLRDGV